VPGERDRLRNRLQAHPGSLTAGKIIDQLLAGWKRCLSARPVEQVGRARPKGIAPIAGVECVGYLDGIQNVTVRK
jgi:hypothetical protein